MTSKTTTMPDTKRSLVLSWDHGVFLIILLLSVITRLWGLGDRALHHDETLHAEYSYSLFAGLGFVHDPLLHGPFLYIMGALTYFFFGDNDATARLSPALFSIALGLTPYLLRRELGRTGAIVASAVMLFSPVFLYIGRFFRHDIYAVLFEVLVLTAMLRYGRTRQPMWLVVGLVALSTMLTNLETTYLYIAIFLPVLVAVFFWQVWRPGLLIVGAVGAMIVASVFILPGKPQPAINPTEDIRVTREHGTYVCPDYDFANYVYNPIKALKPGPIFGFGPLETDDNMYALCVRNQSDNNVPAYFFKLWQFFSHPAIVLGFFSAVFGVLLLWWLVWQRKLANGLTLWQQAKASPTPLITTYASLAADNRVLKALGLAAVPYVLFFSSFFYNPIGIVSGTTGSLLYWLAQHDVKRGGQPGHYYGVMLAIYEPMVVIAAIAAAIVMIVQLIPVIKAKASPSAFLATGMILTYWSLGAFAIFSWAGEKMPWLTIHPLIPLTLLGSWGFGQLVDMWWANHRTQSQGRAGIVTIVAITSVLFLRQLH